MERGERSGVNTLAEREAEAKMQVEIERHSEEFLETGDGERVNKLSVIKFNEAPSIFEVKLNSVEVFVMPRAHDNQIISFDTFLC